MKLTSTIKAIFMTLSIVLVAFAGKAQPSHPNSPHLTATGNVGGANVSITYGSPGVKGREIWGALVPYDKAWRAGADEATIFETDKDLMVQDMKLPAGKYTLFATPGKDEWTFTFNSQVGQWGITRSGVANFDAAKNVIVVKVKPKKSATMMENLTYVITNKHFELNWDHTSVPVTLSTVPTM